jgi:hypothetical protein
MDGFSRVHRQHEIALSAGIFAAERTELRD